MPAQTRDWAASSASPFNVGASRGNTYASAVAAALEPQPWAVGWSHGVDVDADGYGAVVQQRMHQLIRQAKPIRDRRFAIEFLYAGAEVFCFSLG
jgi:Thioredoxin like C-terminal domain